MRRTVRQPMQLAMHRHQGLVRFVVLLHPPGRRQFLADALLVLPRQIVQDIPFLMHLTASYALDSGEVLLRLSKQQEKSSVHNCVDRVY